jgi:hypothetical protein
MRLCCVGFRLLAAVDNRITDTVAVDFRPTGVLVPEIHPSQVPCTWLAWIRIVRHWCHFAGNRAGPVRDRGTHFPSSAPEYRALHGGRGAAIGPPSFLFPSHKLSCCSAHTMERVHVASMRSRFAEPGIWRDLGTSAHGHRFPSQKVGTEAADVQLIWTPLFQGCSYRLFPASNGGFMSWSACEHWSVL